MIKLILQFLFPLILMGCLHFEDKDDDRFNPNYDYQLDEHYSHEGCVGLDGKKI